LKTLLTVSILALLAGCSVEHDTPSSAAPSPSGAAPEEDSNENNEETGIGNGETRDDTGSQNSDNTISSTPSISISEVQAALQAKCGVCHSNSSSPWQTSNPEQIRSLVNWDSPEDSLLLMKGLNTVTHGGNKRWDKIDKEYETVINWIRQGT